jgi:hypothetical protein
MTEYNSSQVEGLALIRDGAQMIADGVNKLLEGTKPKKEVNILHPKPTLEEINSLKYSEKTSDKGPYKIINKAENMNNPAYEKLHAYIAEHNGFVIIHGIKCWIFSNNSDTIGCRKQ